MADKIKELLSVLDLPKDEQFHALYRRGLIDEADYKAVISTISLTKERPSAKEMNEAVEQRDKLIGTVFADLAFRRRDEVSLKDMAAGVYKVAQKLKSSDVQLSTEHITTWFGYTAQPIHWIIAALIAKELTKGE